MKRKVVEPQEAYAKAIDKANLVNMFKKNNIDTSWAPQDPSAPRRPPRRRPPERVRPSSSPWTARTPMRPSWRGARRRWRTARS